MERSLHYTAALLDLDGTVIDSAPGVISCIQKTLAEYGFHPPRESLLQYMGPPIGTAFGDFLPPEHVPRAIEKYRALYGDGGLYDCTVYDGVRALLEALRAAGVTICLATSKSKIYAERILDHFGLTPLFDAVGGTAVGGKPSTKTEVLQAVLALDCMRGKRPIMIGDRKYDAEGARACGLPFAAVLYGYGSRQELSACAPEILVQTPRELAERLLSAQD